MRRRRDRHHRFVLRSADGGSNDMIRTLSREEITHAVKRACVPLCPEDAPVTALAAVLRHQRLHGFIECCGHYFTAGTPRAITAQIVAIHMLQHSSNVRLRCAA